MSGNVISGGSGDAVALVRLDGKCRVVIPRKVREHAGLSAGAVVAVAALGDRVVLKRLQVAELVEGVGL